MARKLILKPFRPDSTYARGEVAGWEVRLESLASGSLNFYYAVKKNGMDVIDSGWLYLSEPRRIEITCDEPAMLLVEVGSMDDEQEAAVAGAAIAPHLLRPSHQIPGDFDAFWAAKLAELSGTPTELQALSKSADRDDVHYEIIRMRVSNDRHVHGQVARPHGAGQLPGFVYFQWAGGPYPLRPAWVTDRASQGWLACNIQPHDVPVDAPQAYYDALPDEVKDYHGVGRDDREKSYYLSMYLAAHRAVEYIANHPQWDGRTLVVMGTSMGGMQALWAAALHPRVTAAIAHVPVGADSNGPLYGRASGYPFWFADTPQTYLTSLYFDIASCAPRIRVPTLMSIGYVDQVAPPAGLWLVFNQLRGYKEVVPLVDAAHNHEATPEQQAPFDMRAEQWLDWILHGGDVRELAPSKPSAAMAAH